MAAQPVNLLWFALLALAVVAAVLLASCSGPGKTATTSATITAKNYRAPSSYRPYAHGDTYRGFRTSEAIPIAESYALDLNADGLGEVHASVNTVAAQQLNVGDRVTITYTVKSVPLIWRRVYVTEVKKPDAGTP